MYLNPNAGKMLYVKSLRYTPDGCEILDLFPPNPIFQLSSLIVFFAFLLFVKVEDYPLYLFVLKKRTCGVGVGREVTDSFKILT